MGVSVVDLKTFPHTLPSLPTKAKKYILTRPRNFYYAPFSEDCSMKGAIIGAGYFAAFHAEAWKRIPNADIVAVVDSVGERAEEFARKWGIPGMYPEAAELLSKHSLDFVDIVTRPQSHLKLTRLAAEHGVNIMCQKPMAPSWEECVKMVKAAEKAGVRLLIHENWRWQPWYREMKRFIDENRLGRLFHLGYRLRVGDGRGEEPYTVQPYFREMSRLLVYETVIHFLDTFRYLEGDLASVFCQIKAVNPVIRGEDCAVVQLTFRSGAQGVIDANRISGPSAPSFTFGECWLEGDKAALRLSEEGRLWLKRYGENETNLPYDFPNYGYRGNSVEATQKHFIQALHNASPCESEGREYLKTMAAVFACYRSADSGRAVDLWEEYGNWWTTPVLPVA